MKTKPFLTTSLLLVTILAFVYFAQPIYAKANSSDLNYIETSDSTAQVVQLFSGAELFIPVAIIIIGFIALTYCTLRNVDVPLQFNNSTSFIDKCRTLGQYIIDHATDPIKNFLYSIYTYCQDNNLTSITGMAAFVAKNAAQFFVALSKWFNSSFISDVNDTSLGFLDLLADNPFSHLNAMSDSNYNNFLTYYSSFDPYYCIGGATSNYSNYRFIYLTSFVEGVYIGCRFVSSTNLELYFYSKIGDIVSITPFSYTLYNDYSASTYNNYYCYLNCPSGFFPTIFDSLHSLGYPMFLIDGSQVNQYAFDSLTWIDNPPLTTPASDQVYYPALDWTIDIWNTWDDISDGVNDMTEKMRAFVGDISLTLDSALANTNVIQGGGEYVFPSMDGIWKYPQYFFDTLKGWGLFVGGCLNAVTVGEGGLSWLFYGGFIIIVCGGIIGKILLG